MSLPPIESTDTDVDHWSDLVRIGFAETIPGSSDHESAVTRVIRWLTEPQFAAYRPQLVALIERKAWAQVFDSFCRVLPFGTGGRRGTVGIGPNRFNPWTLGASVQGHAAFLRQQKPSGPLSVVIAHDVRRFTNQQHLLMDDVPCPVHGMTSRDFAELAAEIYSAAEIKAILPPKGTFLSTPELSFAIRFLDADGGLNISASHNPPDDNGGKFYASTGGQAVAPNDEAMANCVKDIVWVERMPLDRARAAGLVEDLPPEVHESYITTNLRCSKYPKARSAKVVFTSLHGTGKNTVLEVLERAGFDVTLEPTQSTFDGGFPQVPFRFPNPEVPDTMERACALADACEADLVMATDPDADRLGLMVRNLHVDRATGETRSWRFVSGNEIASLLCHALLNQRTRVAMPLVIKTEVTSSILERIARHHGGRVIGHLLVGFKYIGAALHEIEHEGQTHRLVASLSDFVLGAEESHGYLITPEIRDKDAAGAALIIAELASLEKDNGRTLVHTLRALWKNVGYVHNELFSTVMRGVSGRQNMAAIQRRLRESPPTHIAGRAVTSFQDRQDTEGVFGAILSETDRSSRDVLVFELGDDAKVVLRPSGTEPKNKVYVEIRGKPTPNLDAEIRRTADEAHEIGEAFVMQMLDLVGIELPMWCLGISSLVSIEHREHFATTVMPELLRRLEDAADHDEQPSVSDWLKSQVGSYGADPVRLLKPGVHRFIATEAISSGKKLADLFE